MEEIETYRAGVPRLSSEDVLLFPCGLPGFTEHHRFRFVHPQGMAPLIYLQSLKPPHPRFILLPAELVDRNYHFNMEPWDRDVLFPSASLSQPAVRQTEEISLYFVVSVAADRLPTVNMLAPIAIRPTALRGVQAVRADSRYSHAEPLPIPAGKVQ